ncbi:MULTISPECIES: type II toxin-antitoxin system death-on-curing family toxin [unclassified Sphingomonas]|uniref:type II toxin-antitoxin system death-on-curing family toxin n=1 Tax=unclassified Sphingomonas TaxID=196159 RepID=UPI00226A722F|nr:MULTISPECIES: type II toxin-antitoxin system death-on-curing family toxin [unclassified Sphingomonas]
MTTPRWVEVEEAIDLNKQIVAVKPEPFGITLPGALEAAINRPKQHYFYADNVEDRDDLLLLSAKLCVGISEAQAFQQGNKRTGVACMESFLNFNGYAIDSSAHGHLADLVLATAHPDKSQRMDEEEFADNLDLFVRPFHEAIANGYTGSYLSAITAPDSILARSGIEFIGPNLAPGTLIIPFGAYTFPNSKGFFDPRDLRRPDTDDDVAPNDD